VVVEIAAENA